MIIINIPAHTEEKKDATKKIYYQELVHIKGETQENIFISNMNNPWKKWVKSDTPYSNSARIFQTHY